MSNTTNEARSHFSFLRGYIETIESLPTKEDMLAVFFAICKYGLDGDTPDFSGLASEPYLKSLWHAIVRNIDKSLELQKSPGPPHGSRNNPYGRRGKTLEQEPTSEQSQEPEGQRVPDAPKKNEKEFVPPTLSEVADYVSKFGARDPQGFAIYYLEQMTNNGWTYGKKSSPVKNWKNNIQQWLKYHKDEDFSYLKPATGTGRELKCGRDINDDY